MGETKTEMKCFIAISDLVSLLNMSCGFLSIIFSINNEFKIGALLMMLAIIFDSIDGWVARKTNRQDTYGFGKNIDSLSDVVSFGVAPAIFIYKCINTTTAINPMIIIVISLMIVICGVLRLTRYNVISDKLNTNDFIGFPIPGISFIISAYYLSGLFDENIALILSVIVSVLMISNIKYPKFDNNTLIAISALLIILTPFNITLYNINIAALILLLFCLYYLIINLIKK